MSLRLLVRATLPHFHHLPTTLTRRHPTFLRACSSVPLIDAELNSKYPSLFEMPKGATSSKPASHSLIQASGNYYTFDDSAFPEGLPGELEDEFAVSNVRELMVREPALQVIERLRCLASRGISDESFAHSLTMLRGLSGSGKSVVMAHVVQWCRENGWLVLFVPRPRDWVTEKGALESGTGTGAPLSVSKLYPGYYGQPLGAQHILRSFLQAHRQQLNALPQRRSYDHGRYAAGPSSSDRNGNEGAQGNEKGHQESATLAHIAERGLKSLAVASDALYDLRMELSLVEEFPVLVAVDQINALYGDTCFYSQGKKVLPEELLLARTFRCLSPRGTGELLHQDHILRNGAMLYSTTERFPVQSCLTPFRKQIEPLPRDAVVHVRQFDEREIKLALEHYTNHGVYCSPKGVIQDDDVAYLKLVTLGNPAECRRRASNGTAAFGVVPQKRKLQVD